MASRRASESWRHKVERNTGQNLHAGFLLLILLLNLLVWLSLYLSLLPDGFLSLSLHTYVHLGT